VLGGLFVLFATDWAGAFSAEESGFRMLPTWYPILLIVFRTCPARLRRPDDDWQVKFLLKRQADMEPKV